MSHLSATVLESYPQRADSRFVKGTLLITGTLSVMAGALISPALPDMQRAFSDLPNVEFWIRLVLTMPAMFIAFGSPVAGYVVDRFGRKRLLIVMVICYGLAGGSGLIVRTLTLLLVSRAILGLSIAGIRTATTTLIADYYKGRARADFLGYQASFIGMSGVVFLTVGGVLADIGWRYPFMLYLLAFAALPFVILVLYEPPRATVAARSNQISGNDAPMPNGLIVFVYIMMTLTQIVFYIIPVYLPFHLSALVSASATQAGLAIAGLSFFFSISSSQFGRVNQHFSYISTLVVAMTLTGTGYLLINLASSWVTLAPGLALSGMGLGLAVPNLNVWLANGVPEVVRGRALGGLNTALFLGQFMSPVVSQPFVSRLGESAIYAIAGCAFLILGGCIFLARGWLARWTATGYE